MQIVVRRRHFDRTVLQQDRHPHPFETVKVTECKSPLHCASPKPLHPQVLSSSSNSPKFIEIRRGLFTEESHRRHRVSVVCTRTHTRNQLSRRRRNVQFVKESLRRATKYTGIHLRPPNSSKASAFRAYSDSWRLAGLCLCLGRTWVHLVLLVHLTFPRTSAPRLWFSGIEELSVRAIDTFGRVHVCSSTGGRCVFRPLPESPELAPNHKRIRACNLPRKSSRALQNDFCAEVSPASPSPDKRKLEFP